MTADDIGLFAFLVIAFGNILGVIVLGYLALTD